MEAAMMQQLRMNLVLAATLGIFPALLLTSNALASDQGKLTEQFHQVYPLSANGRRTRQRQWARTHCCLGPK